MNNTHNNTGKQATTPFPPGLSGEDRSGEMLRRIIAEEMEAIEEDEELVSFRFGANGENSALPSANQTGTLNQDKAARQIPLKASRANLGTPGAPLTERAK